MEIALLIQLLHSNFMKFATDFRTFETEESRATLVCLYRTSGRFYALEPIYVDCRHALYTARTQPTVIRFTRNKKHNFLHFLERTD